MVGVLVAGQSSCGERYFRCTEDEQCRLDAVVGQCNVGYCSYADPECASGQRYHGSAPEGIGGRCVEADEIEDDGSCGDGRMGPQEDCDDGNARDGDGCNHDCHVSGELLWERTFQGEDPGRTRDDRGYRVAVDGTDAIVVVGEAAVPDAGQNIFVRKYTADGDEVWTKQPGKVGDDEAWAVHVDTDGNVVVGGYIEDAATGRDFWIARFEADGSELWQYELDIGEIAGGVAEPVSDDEVRAVYFAEPDEIVVVGKSLRDGAEDRFAASGTVSPAGVELTSWALAEDEIAGEWDGVADIARVADAWVLCGTRTLEAGGGKSIWLGWFGEDGTPIRDVAIDPAGWPGTQGAEGRRCRAGVDAMLFAGSVGGFELDADGYYGAVDLEGAPLWSRAFDGPTSRRDFAHGIAMDGEGNVIVVGEAGGDPVDGGTETETSAQAWIVKLAPDLSELWSDVYNGPENERDVAFDVITDSRDQIVVVGYQSVAGNDYDLWVRKYRP